MKKEITVGLMYHSFCSTNLGVGALAISECEILRNVAQDLGINIDVLCFEASINDLYSKSTEVKVELIQISYSPKIIKQFRRCDIILDVTGGDSFSDIYGMKNFIGIFLLKFFSIISATPVILSPQTIGPYKHNISKLIANTYLKFVKHIFLRDELSKKDIPKGLNKKLTVASDMAFGLQYKTQQMEQNEKLNVGFNISGLLYSEGYNLNNQCGFSYKEMCNDVINLLIEKGYNVYLVSHVVDNEVRADNDWNVCEEICRMNSKLKIAPFFNNPIEAKNFISGLDLFIGSRMHATIAAISSGVATIPIAYSRKFKGVFEPLGYDVFLDATKMSNKEIINKISEYITKIDELKLKAKIANDTAKKRLEKYKEYLYLFLKDKVGM